MSNSNNNVLVSIVVPVFNAEKYINKSFDSLVNQTLKSFEIIVVNDGSTDGSKKIIEQYVNDYPDIFVYLEKENGGQSSARNLALQYVKGQYVTFIDSDDYVDSKYLETLYTEAQKYDSDMVCSGQNKVDEQGNIMQIIQYNYAEPDKQVMRRLNFAGKLYKTSYLQKHNMRFAEGKTYEDNPFNLTMMFLAKNLRFMPYVGYNQISHVGSTTTKKINEDTLPYKEITNAVEHINQYKSEINNVQIYEFTVISFFVYFIFVANKRHGYLNIEDRKSDLIVVINICDFVVDICDKYFPLFYKNRYIRLLNRNQLDIKQVLGTKLFAILYRVKILKVFVKLYYKL